MDEDVDEVTVLVNCPPEIPTSALDLHKQLVEIPGFTNLGPTAVSHPASEEQSYKKATAHQNDLR